MSQTVTRIVPIRFLIMISWVKIEIVKLYHERHVIHNSFSNVIPGRHTLPDSALAARFRGLSHDV